MIAVGSPDRAVRCNEIIVEAQWLVANDCKLDLTIVERRVSPYVEPEAY
jgi:hypothetical protein